MNVTDILLSAIELSEGLTKSFTEFELSSSTGVSHQDIIKFIEGEGKFFFRATHKKRVKCPKCGADVDVSACLESAFCKKCNTEVKKEDTPSFELIINSIRVKNFFQDELFTKFQQNGWKLESFDDSFAIFSKESIKLALAINLKQALMNDYFLLRGQSADFKPTSFLIASLNFDFLLKSLSEKDLRCNIINLQQVILDLGAVEKRLTERCNILAKNKEVEDITELQFSTFGDLMYIQEHIKDVLENLPNYALQIGDISPSGKGNRFQKHIVSLLNLTLFKAKLVGGPNQPDVVIYFLGDHKPRWYLGEVKSFKDKEGTGFYQLKNSTAEIRKYATSFKKADIAEVIDTPAYIIIANDFDILNKDEQTLIAELEKSTKMKIVLFPLKSIVRMVKLFLDNNIAHLPPDIVESLFSKTGYITPEDIDSIFKDLIKHNKDRDADIFKRVRQYTKAQGL